MSWREQRASARETVHRTFEVPALLLTSLTDTPGAAITCRIHNKYTDQGLTQPPVGASAQQKLDAPRAVFLRSDLTAASMTLARNNILSIKTGEAYRIQRLDPNDIETISADLTRLDSEDSAGLPVPE